MTEQNNPPSEPCSLRGKLATAERNLKMADSYKKEADKLKELIKSSEKETENYRQALVSLQATNKDQDDRIQGMRSHLQELYDDWECILKESFCKDVVHNNWILRQKFEGNMGEPARLLAQAKVELKLAETQLDNWKNISKYIKSKQDENKSLYTRICSLDNCNTPLLQLYLFHFILWPSHKMLGQNPESLCPGDKTPELAYCADDNLCKCDKICPPPKPKTQLVGDPWIIQPEEYDCKLTRAWEAWRTASSNLAIAQNDFDQVERDEQEYQRLTAPDMLEKLAIEAFLKYHKKDCKPCPEKTKKNTGCPDQAKQQEPSQQATDQTDCKDGDPVVIDDGQTPSSSKNTQTKPQPSSGNAVEGE